MFHVFGYCAAKKTSPWVMLFALTNTQSAVVAVLSRWAVDPICAAKLLHGEFGRIFQLILKPLGFFGAPVKLLTVNKTEIRIERIIYCDAIAV